MSLNPCPGFRHHLDRRPRLGSPTRCRARLFPNSLTGRCAVCVGIAGERRSVATGLLAASSHLMAVFLVVAFDTQGNEAQAPRAQLRDKADRLGHQASTALSCQMPQSTPRVLEQGFARADYRPLERTRRRTCRFIPASVSSFPGTDHGGSKRRFHRF